MAQRTVLVVDDDTEFCNSLWDTLREQDFRVGVAHSANEAREEIETGRYQVVMLDLRLGDANGLDVLESISHHRENEGCCGDRCQEGRRAGAKDGAAWSRGICFKPVDMDDLLNLLGA